MTNPYHPDRGDYPRDMIGYERCPPDPHWPAEAALALQIVVNYEEGGENSILHGDAGSESFLTEHFTTGVTGLRHPTIESLWEYGTASTKPRGLTLTHAHSARSGGGRVMSYGPPLPRSDAALMPSMLPTEVLANHGARSSREEPFAIASEALEKGELDR
jgi:hypothetical protein